MNDNSKKIRDQILKWLKEDEAEIVKLFSRLVQCQTPSPPGDTRAAMSLIETFLTERKFASKRVDFSVTMPNIISSVPMAREGNHLMFNGHLDVLPAGDEPGWQDSPWSGKISEGRVWGRGSSDMKAGVVAMLFAYTYIARLRDDLMGKVSITLVSDEETGYGRGTGYMFEQIEGEMEADCVISGEPSGPKSVCFSSKGYLQFSVKVKTRGAISGYPNESKSAIRIAADIVHQLDALEEIELDMPAAISNLLADPEWRGRHDIMMGSGAAELLPRVTVNVGTIQGGSAPSVIAPDCAFSVSVVVPPGADTYAIYLAARDIVDQFPEAEFFFEGVDTADVSDPGSEMAHILQDCVEGLTGIRPDMTPGIAMSDCRYWRHRGTPAFWYGPDGSNCSAANESVDIGELLHVVRVHALAAAEYLSKGPRGQKGRRGKAPKFAPSTPELKSLPKLRVARVSRTVGSFDEIDGVIDSMFSQLYLGLSEAAVAICSTAIATYEEDMSSDDYQLTVTAAYQVGMDVVSTEAFEVLDLPEIQAAVTVHRGSLAKSGKTWNALRRWVGKQGYRAQEVYREIYLVGAPNPVAVWATELQQQIVE